VENRERIGGARLAVNGDGTPPRAVSVSKLRPS
jgi:hypothetical protein